MARGLTSIPVKIVDDAIAVGAEDRHVARRRDQHAHQIAFHVRLLSKVDDGANRRRCGLARH